MEYGTCHPLFKNVWSVENCLSRPVTNVEFIWNEAPYAKQAQKWAMAANSTSLRSDNNKEAHQFYSQGENLIVEHEPIIHNITQLFWTEWNFSPISMASTLMLR